LVSISCSHSSLCGPLLFVLLSPFFPSANHKIFATSF
jgi:hypothetical protein